MAPDARALRLGDLFPASEPVVQTQWTPVGWQFNAFDRQSLSAKRIPRG